MKNILKVTLTLAVLFAAITSCQQKNKKEASKEQFVLNGTIEGMDSGLIQTIDKKYNKTYTAKVVNGKFTLKGDYPEPTHVTLFVEGKDVLTNILAENTEFTLNGHVDHLRDVKVVGGPNHADMLECDALVMPLRLDPARRKAQEENFNPNLSKEKRAENNKLLDEFDQKIKAKEIEFIKNYPKSHQSAWLVMAHCTGANPKQKEKLISLLDSSLYSQTYIKEIRAQLEKQKKTEVTLNEFISDASNIAYKVDQEFKGHDLKSIVYLGLFANNNICALTKDGRVQTIMPSGVKVSEFKAELKGEARSLAVDQDDNIYVLDVLVKKVKRKHRGRLVESTNPVGVECVVHNSKGKEKTRFICSDMTMASGAKVLEGNLILSDCIKGMIGFYDVNTGKQVSKINDMRPCCSILDFAVNANKQLVVANLGAFRVQSFDLTGKSLMSFGKRGRELTAFHGCCNPVSVASLKNGAIVTVEKDPTRIKVYSKEGAKQIEGVNELVKGCAYIPMIVDAKDNLYLASAEKGLVKCISMN